MSLKVFQDLFWQTYRIELANRVRAKPDEYALRPGESAEAYAERTMLKMRETVEHGGRNGSFGSFALINYRESNAMRAAARAVGVEFNLKGLNSLYPIGNPR